MIGIVYTRKMNVNKSHSFFLQKSIQKNEWKEYVVYSRIENKGHLMNNVN